MKTEIEKIHEANRERIKAALERADQRRRQDALNLNHYCHRDRWYGSNWSAVVIIALALTISFALYWFLATHFTR